MTGKFHKAGIGHFLAIHRFIFPNDMNVIRHYNKSINNQLIIFYQVFQTVNYNLFKLIIFKQRGLIEYCDGIEVNRI